jgi:predicted secreted protein
MPFRLALIAAMVALFVIPVSATVASAPPVGPLPPGQATTISTARGTLVAVALPGQPASSGLVWRLARAVNAKVLRQTSERNIGRDVIVVYKAVSPGTATVSYGLTKGETRKAYKSITYKISIR